MAKKRNDNPGYSPLKPPHKEKPLGADGHRQRMYERLINTVDYRITQRDALEMLLYFSIPVSDTRDQAVLLMRDNQNSLINVIRAESEKLQRVHGIGPKTAQLLHTIDAVVERSLALESAETETRRKCYTSVQDIAGLFAKAVDKIDKTETWIASFNSAMQLQKLHMLTPGELTCSPEHMRILLDYTSHNDTNHIAIAKFRRGYDIVPTHEEMQFGSYAAESFYRLGRHMHQYVIVNEAGYMLTGPQFL